MIDIPTIQPGSLFDVCRHSRTNERAATSSKNYASDTPPPLPPNHPKLSDSGVSSAHDSDPDFNLEWHYPDIRDHRIEKRSSSATKVRFSESSVPKPSAASNFASENTLPTVVLPPGKNKTKYADIMGIDNANHRNEGTVQSARKLFSNSFGNGKNKNKQDNKPPVTQKNNGSGSKKFGGKKLWGSHKNKTEVKNANNHLGSSLNGMIHREIAKAMRERKELFDS